MFEKEHVMSNEYDPFGLLGSCHRRKGKQENIQKRRCAEVVRGVNAVC
jgi:hypothetical protein